MRLLVAYVLIVVTVEFFAIMLGLQLDHLAPTFAVPMALTLFFSVLAVGWPIAVFVTDRWLRGKETAA